MNNGSSWGAVSGYLVGYVGAAYLIVYLISRPYERGLHRRGNYTKQKVVWFRIIGTVVLVLIASSQQTGLHNH